MRKTMILMACLALTSIAHAANGTWNVSSGDWSKASNWVGGTLPDADEWAYIQNGGTAVVSTDVTVGRFFPGWNAGSSGTVQIVSGGTLTATSTINIGQCGNGTIYVNGGTLNVDGSRGIDGLLASGSGTIKMDSGKITTSGGEWYLARGGALTWELTGGMFAVGVTICTPYSDNVLTFDGMTVVNPGGRDVASALWVQGGTSIALTDYSTLEIDILGNTKSVSSDVANGYDYLRANHKGVVLDGDLVVYIGNGYTPEAADVFEIVCAAADYGISGSFDNAVNDGDRVITADGKGSFEIDYRANQVFLKNFEVIPDVPEPKTIGLLGCVGLVTLLRRKRRA